MAGHYTKSVRTKARQIVKYFIRLEAAADVDANGYVIDSGGAGVSVAKQAEGVARLTFPHTYVDLLGVQASSNEVGVSAEYRAHSISGKTVDIGFASRDTAFGDVDPDGAVIFVEVTFQAGSPGA